MIDLKFICISGHAGSGKDTVADMMRTYLWGYGERVLITHYADLLKYVCTNFFHWNGVKDEAGRTLLQHIGTDVVRSQEPDYWVGFLAHIFELFPDQWDFVIIPDCRFPNELDYLRAQGFDVTHIHINRPGFVGILTDDQRSHASETSMDDIAPDHTIQNGGSLIDLIRSVTETTYPIWKDEEDKRIEQDRIHGHH